MNMLEAFKEGRVAGESVIPDHIVSAISNLFVFGNKVYKIYKNDNQFFNGNFNDLSNKSGRFLFTRKDFDWNNKLSPEIYTEIKGAVMRDDTVMFTDPTDDSEELVIVMNKIDMSDGLIKRLVENRISIEDCYQIGFQLGQRIMKVQQVFPLSLYEDFISRYKDLTAWALEVKEIPAERVNEYLVFIKDFIEIHKDEFENSTNLMGQCLDIHADNAVYTSGKLLPIDTYSPKADWLHGYKFINIYRVASDIYAFLGKEAFEQVLRGYEEATGEKLPRDKDKFMIIYCELIVWPYQYMLSEKEPWRIDVAKKYGIFIDKIFKGN